MLTTNQRDLIAMEMVRRKMEHVSHICSEEEFALLLGNSLEEARRIIDNIEIEKSIKPKEAFDKMFEVDKRSIIEQLDEVFKK